MDKNKFDKKAQREFEALAKRLKEKAPSKDASQVLEKVAKIVRENS